MAAIAVYCSASPRIDPVHVELAARVGTLIAARGHSLVSGAGSLSMMGAVARATRDGGGRTYGVIPRALLAVEVGDRASDELVVTDDMRQRKALMDEAADAFLVLPGGLGTLEELLEVWSARTLSMHAKPVVVCDPTGVLAGLRGLVDHLVAAGFVTPGAADQAVWTTDPQRALEACEAGLAAPAPGPGPSVDQALESSPPTGEPADGPGPGRAGPGR